MMSKSATTADSDRFARTVVPFEHWYLGFPAGLSPVLNLVVEGTGRIAAAELRRAVAAAAEYCPGARLARHGSRWSDSGQPPPVRLAAGTVLDRSTLNDVAELRRPLPVRGAYCEVVLFDGEFPAVAFRASHAVMDARGLRMWALDVFRALRGEQPEGALSVTTVAELDDPLIAQADAGSQEFVLPSLLGVPADARFGGYRWWRRSVDGTFPAVAARLATELARLTGQSTAPVSIPVDLRPFHPEVRSTSNFAVTVSLQVTPDEGWEATQQQLLTVLSERRGTVRAPGPEVLKVPLGLLRMMVRGVDRKARRTDRFSSVAGVNSLGRTPLDAFATDDFEPGALYLLCPREPASPPGLNVVESEGRTELTLSWWPGKETEARAERLLDTLCESLSPAAHRAQATLLPPVPAARDAGLPTDRTVVELFRDQVRSRPDAVAISGPEGEMSYRELDRRARVIAAELRARGIGRDTVVGLCADRSAAAVTGAWGALLAGAAYLPMDTKHPDGRLRALLQDARAPLCLTQHPYDVRDFLPDGCEPLVLDDLSYAADPAAPPTPPAPSDLAYVVYTSGSTGHPKGVDIEHRSLSNYADWAVREHGIGPHTRLPLLCSLSFDVAQISLVLPFLVGGTLLLMRDELDHLSLQEVIDDGATALALTPSHLDLMTRLGLSPGAVGTLMVIGEQFTRTLALRAREMFGPECRIINLYGPAEATIGVSHHVFDAGRDTGANVPIGLPQDGVSLFLLDAERRFVTPGETGELYIGGVQLARGYRGRPDLTRQRFVRLADGTRAYRTGDLARRLPSGEVECCGRVDDQVKVRGHRIEPSEIAFTLETHPAVAAAVVVPRTPPGRTDRALCGYVVLRPDVPLVEMAELTDHLLEHLPSYMVPAAMLAVEDIPRTVNGKVAASALPDPFADAAAPGDMTPLSDPEVAVAKIWARVLDTDVDGLGPASDFHQLGGDSLAMIAMVAEVASEIVGAAGAEAFTRRAPDFLAQPTLARVAGLAETVRTA
ncbi:amino acid adenylation domain-containing protein [Streptomyces noursei]|uniref:amino acid adenylation domain-containing protein n=1 Tax=Streptomyces noursei TaxID=1971 RepID=UPI0030F33E12